MTDYQLALNKIIVGSIEITGGEFPALEGVFTPNRDFDNYRRIYEKHYSDDPELEKEAEYEMEDLHISLIDSDYLWEDIAYIFINVFENNICTWRMFNEQKYIEFYRANEVPYGCFSNFSKHPIELEGNVWPTTEHYFQAKKFEGYNYEDEIRLAKTPALAAKMGRSKEYPLRQDWEKVKEQIMYEAIYAKFTQHNDCKKLLLQTKDALIIEHTKNDKYWADGGNGKGKNRLGYLLMELREEIREKS